MFENTEYNKCKSAGINAYVNYLLYVFENACTVFSSVRNSFFE